MLQTLTWSVVTISTFAWTNITLSPDPARQLQQLRQDGAVELQPSELALTLQSGERDLAGRQVHHELAQVLQDLVLDQPGHGGVVVKCRVSDEVRALCSQSTNWRVKVILQLFVMLHDRQVNDGMAGSPGQRRSLWLSTVTRDHRL